MMLLIMGASHTGKTQLAQRMLERLHVPYLSQDHLKMGLIRSGHTALTPLDADNELTELLWPITREMIKTAIENRQSMIVEGCYIPADFADDFEAPYTSDIHAIGLVMTERYIREHMEDILRYESVIESRLTHDITMQELIDDNAACERAFIAASCPFIRIDGAYGRIMKESEDMLCEQLQSHL